MFIGVFWVVLESKFPDNSSWVFKFFCSFVFGEWVGDPLMDLHEQSFRQANSIRCVKCWLGHICFKFSAYFLKFSNTLRIKEHDKNQLSEYLGYLPIAAERSHSTGSQNVRKQYFLFCFLIECFKEKSEGDLALFFMQDKNYF